MNHHKSNFIHPLAYIGDNVTMGKDNHIGANCYIDNCNIGNGNRFEGFCSIGTPAEHKTAVSTFRVEIGNSNTIREFVTINCGIERNTQIGNDNWLLAKSHIGHDSIIHDNVTISCFVAIGGNSEVFDYANLGLHACLHQYSVIPPGCMIGMGGIVTKKTKLVPFCTYAGAPVRCVAPNEFYQKSKILTEKEIENFIKKYEQS